MGFEFIDPRVTPWGEPRSRGGLPHLYKEGGSYFVTFRLLDAVETRVKKGSRDGCTTTGLPAAVITAQETEPPLRLGSCLLAQPEIAGLTQNTLTHFNGQRYYLSARCVMPNHVHAVVTPKDGWKLSAILHSWKSFTAHQANQILKRRGLFWE